MVSRSLVTKLTGADRHALVLLPAILAPFVGVRPNESENALPKTPL